MAAATLRGLVAEAAGSPPDQGVPLPTNGWQVFRDALVAATVYE